MKKHTLFLVLLTIFQSLSAQTTDDDKNVVISKCSREFSFVKGNAADPVQVKEESNRTYTCNNYRTDIPIVEFYSDVTTVDDVDIYTNGSKKNGITPVYEYYNSDGIFYSDAHVCYFKLPLLKKGSNSQVIFKKTIRDPRYFNTIYFMNVQPIEDQEIILKVPSWMQLEIKEFNFKNYDIQKTVSTQGDATIYTYRMKNIPALSHESAAPGPGYYVPHILILSKSAQPKSEKINYFNTIKDQYAWYSSLIKQVDNDEKIVKEKTEEIIKGVTGDEQKVKLIYQWVQDNIRYIAFENGIAGFKPEKAQEVIRKKYGDCKGMANLLTEMLLSIHLDARRCWIGTKHIAYDYSTPSMAVDNHMICAWMKNGKPVYLDATEKYIGFGEIAERIQGRQTLIENGNDFLLERVPVEMPVQNRSVELRKFLMDGSNLKGHVVQTWKGENKEWLLSTLNDIKNEKQEDALKQYLSEGKQNFEISNLKIDNLSNYNADLKVEYDVLWKDVLTVFDKETYLDADNRRNLDNFEIDTTKRKLPYWFNFKKNMVFETEIQIPPGKTITSLPEKLSVKEPGYSFNASYNKDGGKLIYKNEIILGQTEIKPENFSQWNKDIKQLNNFYNQQVVLTQSN
ncbi:MAG: transglutaminase-like domain-containing protein [Ferruginibacter sp.]